MITSKALLLILLLCLCWYSQSQNCGVDGKPSCPLNILLILADDLGYGDTSVEPFTGGGVQTPNLERMARRGTVMTNFHTAAATCTPTRASILTGLYPWRLGIKAVFEYGEKGKSNRDDFLIEVPTVAMAFRDADYSTIHSGKWHVGGMRNDDLDMRIIENKKKTNEVGSRRCPHPGPNQQGFENYVSVLDGPGAARQNHLQINDQLYSRGCASLLHNDVLLDKDPKITGYLSYCEVMHAMRMMNDSIARNKPFYAHVWFHAPHGPWEEIPGYAHMYPDQAFPTTEAQVDALPPCKKDKDPLRQQRYCFQGYGKGGKKRVQDTGISRFMKYRTMVSDMDAQIGLLLDYLEDRNIEQHTLVVFLSDNGPEDDAGYTGGHRGKKRFLYEGGVRVPAIFQWRGTIPEGGHVHSPAVSTDLFPTFLDAAGIKLPHLPLDGMSLLPVLLQTHKRKYKHQLQERVTLWHNDYEGPRRTAAWAFDYKLMLDENEAPLELFDMRLDKFETINLLSVAGFTPVMLQHFANYSEQSRFQYHSSLQYSGVYPISYLARYEQTMLRLFGNSSDTQRFIAARNASREHNWGHQYGGGELQRKILMGERNNSLIHEHLLLYLFKPASEYARHGNFSYAQYMSLNPGRLYTPSLMSDQRHVRGNIYKKISPKAAADYKLHLITNTSCGITPCECKVRGLKETKPLFFQQVPAPLQYLNPMRFLNGSQILHIKG